VPHPVCAWSCTIRYILAAWELRAVRKGAGGSAAGCGKQKESDARGRVVAAHELPSHHNIGTVARRQLPQEPWTPASSVLVTCR